MKSCIARAQRTFLIGTRTTTAFHSIPSKKGPQCAITVLVEWPPSQRATRQSNGVDASEWHLHVVGGNTTLHHVQKAG